MKSTVVELYNGTIPDMRKEGYSLQAIGDFCGGVTRERIRQILNKFYPNTVSPLLNENKAEKLLGFPPCSLLQLRRKGLVKPIRRGTFFLYDRAELEKAMLIYYGRSCPMCGKTVPFHHTYCPECAQIRRHNHYRFLTPEQKRKHHALTRRWREAHPERWREIQMKAALALKQRKVEKESK